MRQEKFLIITDTHAKRGELDEFALNWDEAFDICEKRGIKTILFGGDMVYNTASQTLDVLSAIKDVLDKANRKGIMILAIYGNHDMPNREVQNSYLHLFQGRSNFQVSNQIIVCPEDCNFKLQMVSYYLENEKFDEFFDDIILQKSKTRKNILLLHEGINGGLSIEAKENKELPAKMFEDFDLVLCGHYHNRAKISDNIQYIGASRQMSFGEDDQKGYTILFDDGSIEFIQNQVNKRFTTIETSFKKLNQNTIEEISELADEGYKIRLIVNCEKNEVNLINKSDYLKAGATKVVIKSDEASVNVKANQSAFTKYDKSGIINSYSAFCEEKNTDPTFGEKYIKTIS